MHNVIGTYMHGSLLPKNPAISDFLIETAVTRRYVRSIRPIRPPNKPRSSPGSIK